MNLCSTKSLTLNQHRFGMKMYDKNSYGLAMAQIRLDTQWVWRGLIWTLYGPGPDWIGHFSMGLAQIRLDTMGRAQTGLDNFSMGRVCPRPQYVDYERFCMTVFLLSISCDIVEN